MSPASQGALEVERYIGSCLISSNVRPGGHKPLVNKKQEPVIRGKSRGCYAGQSYGSTGEQCQVQYGPSGWTGAPLISMTSSPRRCNQRSSPLLGQQQQQPQQQQQQQQQQSCEQQIPGHLHVKSPLSRLAIHTQGAPLILAGRFHNRGKLHNGSVTGTLTNTVCGNQPGNGYAAGNTVAMTTSTALPTMTPASSSSSSSNNNNNNNTMGNPGSRCPPSRPQRPVAEPGKKQQSNSKPECTGGKDPTGTNIANIDSLSIASDESSGSNNSENSLPRIIKPRKRRKKDRKPLNSVPVPLDGKHEEQQQQLQHHHHHHHHHHQQQQQLQQQQHQQQPGLIPSMEQSTNPVGLKSYLAGCYEQRYELAPAHVRNHRRPPMGRESVYCNKPQTAATGSPMLEIADVRQRYAHRHVEVKVLDGNRNIVPVVARPIPGKGCRNGHQIGAAGNCGSGTGNPVPGTRYLREYTTQQDSAGCEGIKDGLGLCQCRYCDPSGLIWDVDQNCYSPFLTPSSTAGEFCPSSSGRFPQIPLFLARTPSVLGCQEQSLERLFDAEEPRVRQQERDCGPGVVLRRSWSDPTSYFSEEIATPSKDVGVIGDRGQQTENGKRRTLWRGETIGIPSGNGPINNQGGNGAVGSPKGLEVSTEIITSPNGHRDLEIKFYSASPNATLGEEKTLPTEEVDEEEEDFSDIWSYHESKLQQDFRTLLQAEE